MTLGFITTSAHQVLPTTYPVHSQPRATTSKLCIVCFMLLVIGARGRVQPILACNVHISLAGKHPGDEMAEAASSVFLLAERDMASLVPRKVVPSTEYITQCGIRVRRTVECTSVLRGTHVKRKRGEQSTARTTTTPYYYGYPYVSQIDGT
jgi:hypothetical protein